MAAVAAAAAEGAGDGAPARLDLLSAAAALEGAAATTAEAFEEEPP